MTKRQKKARLLRAAVSIFDGTEIFSCVAIQQIYNEDSIYYADYMDLRTAYGDFIGLQNSQQYICIGDRAALSRQLALLLFAETL